MNNVLVFYFRREALRGSTSCAWIILASRKIDLQIIRPVQVLDLVIRCLGSRTFALKGIIEIAWNVPDLTFNSLKIPLIHNSGL